MASIGAIQSHDVEFMKDGGLFLAGQREDLVRVLKDGGITDLLVLSHGWNNDTADAKALYAELLGNLAKCEAPPGSRRFAALTVLWPSKKFTDAELIPGGRAALGDDRELDGVRRQLEAMKHEPKRLGVDAPVEPARRTHLDAALALLPTLKTDAAARQAFVEHVRATLPRTAAHPEDRSDAFFAADEKTLLSELSKDVPIAVARPRGGGAAGGIGTRGGAAGLADVGAGIVSGVRRMMNFVTYYEMKARAGEVGAKGLGPLLAHVKERVPTVRLHLVGHSFGGRVVTAAVHADVAPPIDSLSLLQSAFSHHGFAQKFDQQHDGFFRSVVTKRKVRGPILVTHTKNDKAVGIAYPLASRIAGQNAAALGDENDPYGGLGRNGALKLAPADVAAPGTLLKPGSAYAWQPGKFHNLRADEFISDHSDVRNPAVAWAIASAIGAT